MKKTRSFSIYLLKENYDANNSQKNNEGLRVKTTLLPKNATLYVFDNPAYEPWWKNYFGIEKELYQSHKGAFVYLPVKERVFVLVFGHVHHHLNEFSYEYDFGLRVTLNCIDPSKIKNTDTLQPELTRRQRTQLAIGSELNYFDFDYNSSIMKSITGKVKEEYSELIKQVTGASSLHINSSVSPGELINLCKNLFEIYRNEDYKKIFPNIHNIEPTRDPEIINSLNNELLGAICKKKENIYLAVPDFIDYSQTSYITFHGEGKSSNYNDLKIEKYYEYLESHNYDLSNVTVECLKKHTLEVIDENFQIKKKCTIYKSLIFDTSFHENHYHFLEGNWYKVAKNYINKLKNFLDPLCIDLPFPVYAHDCEGDYNKEVAKGNSSYICLDKGNISLKGQHQLEPCDLYAVSDGYAFFYHIKRSTSSQKLSHLFNQGSNSIAILKGEKQAIDKLKSLLEKNHCGIDFLDPLDANKFEVIFCIITHKTLDKSDNLPLFSRISLKRNVEYLQLMNVKASFGFINTN